MEHPSAADQSLPDEVRPTLVRPPGLEFAMGMAWFGITMMVFFLVQTGVFIAEVVARTPELAKDGFHFGMLRDPAFHEVMKSFGTHGDVVAASAFWSGLVALVVLLILVYQWKGKRTREFLGLFLPTPMRFIQWLGIFLLLGLSIEGLSYLSPAFDTDFMEKVLGTTTDRWMLVLGVGLMAPLFEEFLLRGLFYGSLRHLTDEHRAVAITSGVFALMHMQYDWAIMLLIVPMGVVLGYSRSRGNSIWVAVILHMLNNTVSIFLP